MCNECAEAQKSESKNDQRERSTAGVASSADVSPNTPKADEADV
jgi:hypothetical protein